MSISDCYRPVHGCRGLLRRWNQLGAIVDDLALVVTMGGVSLVGAAFGCVVSGQFPIIALKRVGSGYLIAVGLWMLYEAITHTERILLTPEGVRELLLLAQLDLSSRL